MKISINWLKDFVDLEGISTEEIVKRFNLSTAEIEGVEKRGADIQDVITARIDKISKHPNSEKLQIMQLNIGKAEPVQVLTTAKNIYEGMVTAFVQVGGRVCGQKIGKAVMGGEPSYGMGCSESDLGIGADDAGLWDIKEEVPLGVNIKDIWQIDDSVFEIDNKTLSNRPDLWGHVGIAREMAAIFGRELKLPKMHSTAQYKNLKEIPITIKTEDCYRYSAIAVENVNRKASPTSMKIRLNYCGMRDINFIADLTNYLMLELGQPMHAFDYKKVNSICVKKSEKDTKMTTLEKEEHALPEGSMIICDGAETPVAVAGIKGGLLSGISEETNSFLLESACFEASSIRKTSRGIGLATDASIRYEKSLDPCGTINSIERLLEILKEIEPNAQVVTRLSDKVNYLYPKAEISFTGDFIRSRIGTEISDEKIAQILTSLEFKVSKNANGFVAEVPTFRATKDVSIREDLVEEVARMYGYDNIEASPINVAVAPKVQDKEHVGEYNAKHLMASKYGVREVHTYVWKYKEFCDRLGIDMPVAVSLLDSSNSGQSGLRSAMLPTLLKAYEENKNSTMPLRIAEIGRVVTGVKENGRSCEEKHLAAVFAAESKAEEQTLQAMLAMVKDIAESVFSTSVRYNSTTSAPNYFSSINSAEVISKNNEVIGYIGLLNEKMSGMLDKRYSVAMVELNFARLAKAQIERKGKISLSKFQSVKIDFNFLVDGNLPYAEVEKTINMFHPKIECEWSLIDVFQDKSLGDKKSLTIRAEICANDRTLSGEDIDRFRTKFLSHMERFGISMKN